MSCNQDRLVELFSRMVGVGEANTRSISDFMDAAKHFKEELNQVNTTSDTIPVCFLRFVKEKAISPAQGAKVKKFRLQFNQLRTKIKKPN